MGKSKWFRLTAKPHSHKTIKKSLRLTAMETTPTTAELNIPKIINTLRPGFMKQELMNLAY